MMLFNLLDKNLKFYVHDFIIHMSHDLQLLKMIKVSLTPFCMGVHETKLSPLFLIYFQVSVSELLISSGLFSGRYFDSHIYLKWRT